MKKKMMKAMKDLNAYIDGDRQKLCDRVHDLQLSYNRFRRFLNLLDSQLKDIQRYWDHGDADHIVYNNQLAYLRREIQLKLEYPYLVCNERIKNG